ncbi:MAG: HTH domain-containing protein [Calditrichota bacterium]
MEVGLVLMLALITGGIAWLRMDAVLTPNRNWGPPPKSSTVSPEMKLQAVKGGDTAGSRQQQSMEWFGKIFNFTGEPLDRRYTILNLIASDQSLDYRYLEDKFDISRRTIKRDLQVLKDLKLITFTGAPKTGKYTFTEFGRSTWQAL